jgi:hypothetical protein
MARMSGSARKRRRLTESELDAVRKRAHRYMTAPRTPRKEARDLWLLGDGPPGTRDLDWSRVRDASPEALTRIDLYLRARDA